MLGMNAKSNPTNNGSWNFTIRYYCLSKRSAWIVYWSQTSKSISLTAPPFWSHILHGRWFEALKCNSISILPLVPPWCLLFDKAAIASRMWMWIFLYQNPEVRTRDGRFLSVDCTLYVRRLAVAHNYKWILKGKCNNNQYPALHRLQFPQCCKCLMYHRYNMSRMNGQQWYSL